MKNKIKTLIVIALTLASINPGIYGQEDLLFRKHIISSGWNGLYYGIALDVIAELDGGAAVGIPVITAGSCALLPLLTNPSRKIEYDALVLNGHGKTLGWAYGFGLATLIGGEKAWWGENHESNNYKLTVATGALSSIGLGILGYSLARKNDWPEGKAELYRHYGWVMPFTGFCISAAFSDEPRFFGGSVLAFGAGGYLLADKISSLHDYTRGEMRALQVFTGLNTGLGFGIFSDLQERNEYEEDFKRTDWLIPAAGALAGTLIGHFWVKNTGLTPRQGVLTAYATTGGAIIGLGIALLTESDNITPYYLLPYAGGLAAYAVTIELMRKKNNSMAFLPSIHKNNFNMVFMPQNLFLNNKIEQKGFMINGKYIGMQPLVAASVTF